MTPKEQTRLQILNSLMVEHVTVDQTATLMGVSPRHTRRILAAYQEKGAATVAHGHRGRKPANATPEVVATAVVHLARTRYAGANHTHLSELLSEREDVDIGRTTLRRILVNAGLSSPRRRRPPKHRVRRQRMPREGMLIQMDGVAREQRKRLETIEDELEDVKRKLGRIWHFVETTEIDMADASDRIKEHRERQERLEDAAADARAILSQRRAVLDDVNTIAAYAQDMSEFLNESELTERRAFIETFVKEIVVMPGDALLRYTIPISQSTPKIAVLVGGGLGGLRVGDEASGALVAALWIYKLLAIDNNGV